MSTQHVADHGADRRSEFRCADPGHSWTLAGDSRVSSRCFQRAMPSSSWTCCRFPRSWMSPHPGAPGSFLIACGPSDATQGAAVLFSPQPRRAVEPFSRDAEDSGEWSTDLPSLAERREALPGIRHRADSDRLPAQCCRGRRGGIVAGVFDRRGRRRRALARRQLAACDRGSPCSRIDHPVHDATAFSRCAGGTRRLARASGPGPGFPIRPGTH